MKKENSYKKNFTSNPTGKNQHGESQIIGDKTKKMFCLSIDLVERLKEYAKIKGVTQSDIAEIALRKYIRATQAKG